MRGWSESPPAKGGPSLAAKRSRPGTRHVVAAQLAFEELPNLEAVREHLLARLIEARMREPHLVVFPAFTGLLLLHLFAGRWRFGPGLADDVRRYGLAAEETLLDWSRTFARETGLFLVPGTCLVPSDDGLLHVGYLFGPDGQLLGRQVQTHVRAREATLGLVAGTELHAWDLEGMRVGMAVGGDAWYPEVGRILALQGVTVMLCPTAVAKPYTPWQQFAGAWQQVQSNQFFAAEASLAGEAGGRRFEGRTAVLAPVEITPGGRGFLAEAPGPRRDATVEAELEFPRLFRARKDYPLVRHLNVDLYERSFPDLYHRWLAQTDVPVAVRRA